MYKVIKRFLDFILSVICLPFIIIAIIIFGVLIKIEDRGPIFYFADRIGKNGKIFKMFKFRSMVQDAPDLRMEDGSTFNSENDSRVTKLGKFMRKTSIDEVPQILNVLIGDMSFIGPRPDSAMWIDNYTEEERIIHKVAPGISGYNQVINRNSVTTKEKLQNDIYYVENLSFFLDFKILIMTIITIVKSKNIYRDEEDHIV
ncbi:UDP-phosphate galactose phosphotransferase [Carnobacterium maltaromaticum]|uniref:sugar transferase n=1 Tax=Carnobacterium maltaromaticum TaxID=2751 RepID=UPI0010716669|nr:sugar transferase [Carnobacterium maltaromaticum]TFJ24171.1 UDP-phosphate galactose phosphotransferase [Carnobacterium maltaromaticum]TFJ29576.1 UDP-phosphate galactose phosphotransferase [Carnobacterium maltaromaticum]TFJ32714.1 UDP-phosphate galactose phosphotransferase [Carnobacterium maltaromaticum]TFJ34830.1 UDP-phosphate galactose phosphotransferase [Carnobacterium maltaromaticum]TFJ42019.1 UDP-phosphate galactose phosphotransferase [Carnobacterium maltaromaticum]